MFLIHFSTAFWFSLSLSGRAKLKYTKLLDSNFEILLKSIMVIYAN